MKKSLGYVTPVRAFSCAGGVYMQAASGRVADALAKHYDKVYICTRVIEDSSLAPGDLPLESRNMEFIAQPSYCTTAGSLLHVFGIARAYLRTCQQSDVLFVRGMCPYIAVLYIFAFLFRRPMCHWIVGDPVTLLRNERRSGPIRDAFALLYALQDRMFSLIGRWFTNGVFVCNGAELARAYQSPRTIAAVSSTVRETEFFSRADTCQGKAIQLLFVGFIRPEKGIEYLLRAASLLRTDLHWKLEIVGTNEFPDYRKRLDEIVATHGLHEHVQWTGYMPYGQPLFDRMRTADIFILPTLSEGTPHVLVEARAQSLPCISTTVGGVPSMVRHEYDALLVPPKDPEALARAIERVVYDGELRRAMIRNGTTASRHQTLERFVSVVRGELESPLAVSKTATARE